MHQKDKPVIFIHPVTGEYKIPMRNDEPMSLNYKMLGYERREFNSYHEHEQWCKSKGLVNHKAEGIHDENDALGKNRWGY